LSWSLFSQLITETLTGLGNLPKELCEVEEGARAVTHSLALLQQYSTYSSQNLNLRSYEWEPSARVESLLGVPDIALPAWVERKWKTNVDPSQDFWQDVRVCNLSELETNRTRGDWNKCAFYIDEGQMYIKFSYDPTDYTYRTHRLYYSPDVILAAAFEDTVLGSQATGISQNFFPLVSGMAELELISTIKIRAAMNKDDNKALVSALDGRQAYLGVKVSEWKDRFDHWTMGERGNRRGGRRRKILNGARF
jgi:hypothetical protein